MNPDNLSQQCLSPTEPGECFKYEDRLMSFVTENIPGPLGEK